MIFGGLIYGVARVLGYHPYARPQYREWLAQTPWAYGKPLPLGTFHLRWNDLIVVGLLVGYATLCAWLSGDAIKGYQGPPGLWIAPIGVVLCFFVAYLLCLVAMIGDDPKTSLAVASLMPLIVYPHFNPWIGLAVLAAIYVLARIGIRRTLSQFPWNRPDWTQTTSQRFKSELITERVIGWPYRSIGPEAVAIKKGTVLTALASSALIAWWMFAMLHSVELIFMMSLEMNGITLDELSNYIASQRSDADNVRANEFVLRLNSNRIYLITIMFAAFITACFKISIRIGTPARPPISLFGRFATRRRIISGHDKIFLMPLGIFIGGSAAGWALLSLNLAPLSLTPAAMTFILCFLYMLPYPDPEHWKYTGQFSLVRSVSLRQTSSTSSKKQGGQIEIKLPGSG